MHCRFSLSSNFDHLLSFSSSSGQSFKSGQSVLFPLKVSETEKELCSNGDVSRVDMGMSAKTEDSCMSRSRRQMKLCFFYIISWFEIWICSKFIIYLWVSQDIHCQELS